MRIIGGKHRRRRFDVPKSFNARPTTDFAKENLFNVLQHLIDLEDADALDLFAGTGSITMELVSRGCRSVVAIEMRREHANFIRCVAQLLGESQAVRILQTDAFRYLRQGGVALFDFVFADPPYKLSEIADLPDIILSSGLLRPEAVVVVEHPATYNFTEHPAFVQHRAYGSVNFSIFRLGQADAE